jgi:hypothetical protein
VRRLSSSRERSPRYAGLFEKRDQKLTHGLQKKEINSSRAADQKAIDKALIANIKKVDLLASYLASSFSLRKGDKPHEMAW